MKRITDGQILGELGVALIKTRTLEMGFTWHPSNASVEAGIDGWIELRDSGTGEVANCWLAVQSRARSELENETDRSVAYTCKQKDLEYWMTGNAPVILVVSRPKRDEAWWVSVKDYFRERDWRTGRRVTFDKQRDKFDATAAVALKSLGNHSGNGSYFTPDRRNERLISNLLRLNGWADTVYSASTPYRKQKEAFEKLRESTQWPPREWTLCNGRLYSFHDLSKEPWCHVCDVQSIETFPTDEWAYSSSTDQQRMFTRMMNNCMREVLGRWRMRYSTDQDCYYFKPNSGDFCTKLPPREVRYKSQKKRTKRTVFKGYMAKKDPERIAYYRHDGLSFRFKRYGEQWYLEMTPTYVFTSDGAEPDPYREERQAKIKQIEGDGAVAGRLFMFADILRDEETLFRKPYPFLKFGKLERADMEVGIDDQAWSRSKAQARDSEEPSVTRCDDTLPQKTLFD